MRDKLQVISLREIERWDLERGRDGRTYFSVVSNGTGELTLLG
jgi:hypothetical protein